MLSGADVSLTKLKDYAEIVRLLVDDAIIAVGRPTKADRVDRHRSG
jgi:hypothetical protein